MAIEMIIEIFALAKRVPEFFAAIQQLVAEGKEPSAEFIQEWKDKLQASTAERNDVIAAAKARLGH